MHAAKSFAAVARVLRRAETHRRTRNLSVGMAVSVQQQRSNAMSGSGFPSMTALLGLLAVAGYQNRDKIAEMLRGAQRNPGAERYQEIWAGCWGEPALET